MATPGLSGIKGTPGVASVSLFRRKHSLAKKKKKKKKKVKYG